LISEWRAFFKEKCGFTDERVKEYAERFAVMKFEHLPTLLENFESIPPQQRSQYLTQFIADNTPFEVVSFVCFMLFYSIDILDRTHAWHQTSSLRKRQASRREK
jgi:hypothetical protein